jgi:hypothetical protein
MRESWQQLVESVLRPARPELARCLAARERHAAARAASEDARRLAIADCVRRIERARAEVLAADDGVVAWRMTHLEREWRALARRDPDAGLMDLWAELVPASWIDRKRWRDGEPASRLDALVLLAADPRGVEAAESAVASLRDALTPWGVRVGARVLWRVLGPAGGAGGPAGEADADCTTDLLAEPLRAARASLAASEIERAVLERAARLEREVHDALLARLPDRPSLARGVGRAAFVDLVRRAAPRDSRPDPIAPLRELWGAGYALADAGPAGVTVEIPPGPRSVTIAAGAAPPA